MGLKEYHQKRDFKKTSEPVGAKPLSSSTEHPMFVIQRHEATRLHYDLRLEMDGVLKSWAVPKVPIADPKIKRLAIHVEDHPIDYGNFEGVIPAGQYGAGNVSIWDRGTWDPPPNAAKSYHDGKLKFGLHGKRLNGTWELVRTKESTQWLFMKVKEDPLSFVSPQLATLTEKPPRGEEWIHEIKFDGYRTLAQIQNGKVTFWSRSGLDWTDKYKLLIPELRRVKLNSALIDGEIAWVDERGVSDFSYLQEALKTGKDDRLVFYAFDLLYLDGRNLMRESLQRRKEILLELIESSKSPRLIYSKDFTGDGQQILDQACHLGLEGIVSKRREDPYLSGRWTSWLKTKCSKREEFVVGGYTLPAGSRSAFGALLLGSYNEKGQLVFRGRVGTGFKEADLRDVMKRLGRRRLSHSPFHLNSPPNNKSTVWLPPKVVVEVAFRDWTKSQNVIKEGVYKGMRLDKDPRTIMSESLPNRGGSSTRYKITNENKVLYPQVGITKSQIAAYYFEVCGLMLPYVADRPLALVRCPDNINKECFFQKQLTTPAEGVKMEEIKTSHGVKKMIWIEDQAGLMALVQLGTIEIHTWQAKVQKIDQPDQIVIDLDPDPSVSFKDVKKAALDLHELLSEMKISSFPKLTGGKGVHIHVPIATRGWEEAKELARTIGRIMLQRNPDRYTLKIAKAERKGRIFFDYLRNSFGATAIAPYSLRAKPTAPSAIPLSWDELKKTKTPDEWDLNRVIKAVRAGRGDPWFQT